jgi:capsule polysaccharide export protein KpsC/LpsZ
MITTSASSFIRIGSSGDSRLIGGQPGAIPAETLDRIRNHPSVEIVSDDLNPYSLIDAADKVFVVTSGMGFEALMPGKEVWCFGAPFYAGWGATRDQIVIPRRRARRSVVEIFHVFYLRLSRYFVPDRNRVCELEELIAYMQQVRPWSLGAPQKSDESPVRFAECPVRFAALDDVRTIWALGIPSRAEKAFRQLFSDKRVNFRGTGQIDFSAVSTSAAPAILYIGDAKAPGVAVFARSNGVPLSRLREGLIRATSYPLGDLLPYSLFIEKVGSARREHESTDLVACVETTDFDADLQLLSRARALRAFLVEAGISEYTLPLPGVTAPYGAKTTERILVIGSREATSESCVRSSSWRSRTIRAGRSSTGTMPSASGPMERRMANWRTSASRAPIPCRWIASSTAWIASIRIARSAAGTRCAAAFRSRRPARHSMRAGD